VNLRFDKISFLLLLLVSILPFQNCSSGYKAANFSSNSGTSVFVPLDNGQKLCVSAPIPGRTTLQRLNHEEYNNTLRDLLHITSRPADAFPPDATSTFHNNADSISLNSTVLDLMIAAAGAAVDEAFTLNRAQFMICAQTTTACATQILQAFADKAYRRPATAAEVAALVAFVSTATGQGQSFETGIKLAMQAALSSPNFLFRGIKNPSPNDPGSVVDLSPYELASRLSYFIWASMPDDQLFTAAKNGQLSDPAVLNAQVLRMLKDPKATPALVTNMAIPWMGLDLFSQIEPTQAGFPELTDSLKSDMMSETTNFFSDMISADRSFTNMVTADYSFLNGPMANLYGVSGVQGTAFTKVQFPVGTGRKGILGQASILALTSHVTETSIVRRGRFIAANLLCDVPPPPPAMFTLPPGLTPAQASAARLTTVGCRECHTRLDPLGAPLEQFGPIGKFRTTYTAGGTVNITGQLTDGTTVDGADQLASALEKSPKFPACVASKVLTYALGRSLTAQDNCVVSQLAQTVSDQQGLSKLILAIVNSDTFRKQAGEGAAP
jgi:hypothetical protein